MNTLQARAHDHASDRLLDALARRLVRRDEAVRLQRIRADHWQEKALAQAAVIAGLLDQVRALHLEVADVRSRSVLLEDELLRLADLRRRP